MHEARKVKGNLEAEWEGKMRPVKDTSLSEAVGFSSREVEVSFGGEEM